MTKGYGGIDRVYGELSYKAADKVLDLIEEYEELVEAVAQGERESEEVSDGINVKM